MSEPTQPQLAGIGSGCSIAVAWLKGIGELTVDDPATGATLRSVALAGSTGCSASVAAAERAGPMWASTPAREGTDLSWRAHALMLAESEPIATLITRENGKSFRDARGRGPVRRLVPELVPGDQIPRHAPVTFLSLRRRSLHRYSCSSPRLSTVAVSRRRRAGVTVPPVNVLSTADEVNDQRRRVAPDKKIRLVQLVGSIPRSPSGRIPRRALRHLPASFS